ncbi:serine/threonine-protein phosphatase 7 long form homolog [Camellia sinensis]|uniref:serine/threonine-protein phosphatase 7 long form homolog n=1 Tax=Camellia sinensis TaxID=4442 RepID=UPI001036D58F|nr:serine/threonine-protein phosphatase 7 long form homolog [Camellia sinensis]
MDPSPADPTVLTLQQSYRSILAWTFSDDVDSVILTCRYREATIVRMGRPDARIFPYLQRAGFCRLIHVPFIQLGWHLIVVIVERWRSETHTFHLTSGEVTITLQDVNILSGLRVDGNAVSGNTGYDWPVICNRLLGTVPPTNQLKGSRLNMTWLSQTCGNLPIDVDDVIVQRYARAFILQLLGGSIFAGKSGNMVQLMFLPLLEDFDATGEYS